MFKPTNRIIPVLKNRKTNPYFFGKKIDQEKNNDCSFIRTKEIESLERLLTKKYLPKDMNNYNQIHKEDQQLIENETKSQHSSFASIQLPTHTDLKRLKNAFKFLNQNKIVSIDISYCEPIHKDCFDLMKLKNVSHMEMSSYNGKNKLFEMISNDIKTLNAPLCENLSIEPFTFYNKFKIECLDLSFCDLSSVNQDCFKDCFNIKVLILRQVKTKRTMNLNLLIPLTTSLEYLDISGSDFELIFEPNSKDFIQFKKLKYLVLNKSQQKNLEFIKKIFPSIEHFYLDGKEQNLNFQKN